MLCKWNQTVCDLLRLAFPLSSMPLRPTQAAARIAFLPLLPSGVPRSFSFSQTSLLFLASEPGTPTWFPLIWAVSGEGAGFMGSGLQVLVGTRVTVVFSFDLKSMSENMKHAKCTNYPRALWTAFVARLPCPLLPFTKDGSVCAHLPSWPGVARASVVKVWVHLSRLRLGSLAPPAVAASPCPTGCETRRHGQDLVTKGKASALGSGPGVPRSGGFQKSLTVLPESESSVAGAGEGVLTGLLALSCCTGWL